MGIGSLSGQEMDAANVNQIISNLTKQFSMAFMTSVIGLPVSAAFRTILVVAPLKPRLKQRSSQPFGHTKTDPVELTNQACGPSSTA